MTERLRKCAIVIGCLAGLVGVPGSALAQRTTGSIVGTVKDDVGALLPGVTVTLKGDAVVGTETSVSNERGFYRFAALPPGAYDLTFVLQGFATLRRVGVRVALGATEEADASLKLGQFAEELLVTGEAPVVDTQSTQVGTNYDKDWVRNAPLRRFSFFDLINAAPGVNQSSTTDAFSTSFGSGTNENSYQLDGTDFTAPLTGAAWPWPNTDAIEEIEVLSLGAPAEYGGVQGAVFNVVTRQGSNAFHGDANFYFQSQGLTSRNTTSVQDGGQPYHRDKYRDLTLQLGGPILKDKLWFFASYQYQRDYESPAGTASDFPSVYEADRYFGKLNWQISQRNKLMLAFHDDVYRIPFGFSAAAAPSTIQVETGATPSPNVTFTSVLSDKTYVETRYAGFYGNDHGGPNEPAEPRIKPRFLDVDTGLVTGGVYSWYDGDVWKTTASVKLSHFSDSFLGGSHDFRFGVQYNSGGNDYAGGYNDLIYVYGGETAFGYTQSPRRFGGEMWSAGAFADDTLRVGTRLSLDLGLRFDRSRASIPSYPLLDAMGNEVGGTTSAIDNLYEWNTFSPRAGFNFKLTSDGRTVLKTHYGRYYRGVITGEFGLVGPSVTPRFFGSFDLSSQTFSDLQLASDNTNLRVDPKFKSPHTDQFIVGFAREVTKNFGVAVNYIHKRGRNYGAWKDVGGRYVPGTYVDGQGLEATNQPIDVLMLAGDPADRRFLLTNPREMFTRYDGVVLAVEKRMSDHWEMQSSLVLSRASGRLGSSLGAPGARQASTAGSFGQNPNDYINTDGRLIEDRPLAIKTQLVYEVPRGFLVGLSFTHQTGRPWARQVRVSELVGIPTTILAEKLDGSRRVSDLNVLDVRLQKQFGASDGLNCALFLDGLNILNTDAHEGVQSRLATADAFGRPDSFIIPRRVMLGAKLRF